MTKKAKSNSIATVTVLPDNRLLFKVIGAGERIFDPMKATIEVRQRAMLHGFTQRGADRMALARNTETGLPATPQEKFARFSAWADHIEAGGEWEMRAAAAPRDDTGLTLQGIMRALGLDLEATEARLAKMATKLGIERDAAIKRLAQAPDVIKAIAEIKAERAAANSAVNAADLLADLMDEGDEGEDEDAPM